MNWHLSEVHGDETKRGTAVPSSPWIAFYQAFNTAI